MLLNESEKNTFMEWREEVENKTMMQLFKIPGKDSFFDVIAHYIPDYVAPNVLTLGGLMIMVQSWYFNTLYSAKMPSSCVLFAIVSIAIYWVLHQVDSRHARNTMNDTPLGTLLKYSCDNLVMCFMVSTLCMLFSPNDEETHWYAMHAGQLLFMFKHFSAFSRHSSVRYWIVGPNECVSSVIYVLCLRFWLSGDFLFTRFLILYGKLNKLAYEVGSPYSSYFGPEEGSIDEATVMRDFIRTAYYTVVLSFVIQCVLRTGNVFTSVSLITVLSFRMLPTLLGFAGFLDALEWEREEISPKNVLLDGLFLSVCTSDLVVGKMAGREMHTAVIFMGLCKCLPFMDFILLAFVFGYYSMLFTELCYSLNMPFLTVFTNVYCDGVFDLCHIGHKNLFKAALKHGNRLIVGVCGDADCAVYKRPPVMTAAEREAEVQGCKAVTKVISNAPTFGLTEEFLKKHRIHIVCCGQEYFDRYPNAKDDPYYSLPRKMGIARPLPRTLALSTTELISRIQSSQPAAERSDAPALNTKNIHMKLSLTAGAESVAKDLAALGYKIGIPDENNINENSTTDARISPEVSIGESSIDTKKPEVPVTLIQRKVIQ